MMDKQERNHNSDGRYKILFGKFLGTAIKAIPFVHAIATYFDVKLKAKLAAYVVLISYDEESRGQPQIIIFECQKMKSRQVGAWKTEE